MTRARDTGSIFASDGSLNISTSVNLGDNEKALFGASNDLQIYHDGTHSYISDQGSGNLYLQSASYLVLETANGSENYLVAQENGPVTLYYDNTAKLATTATGVDVTGVITTDGLTTSADINFGDNDKAIFGAGSDLQIYHDGSNSYVQDQGTGSLRLGSDSVVQIGKATAWGELMAQFTADGGCELRHDNSAKLNTSSTGINVTGAVSATSTVTGSVLRTNNVGTAAAPSILFDQDGGHGATGFIGGSSSEYVAVINNGSETARFTNSGKVGIGESNPLSSLHIDAGNGAENFIRLHDGNSDYGAALGLGSTGDFVISTYHGGTLLEALRVDRPTGNVGIGTSSPAQLLHVNSTGNVAAAQIQGASHTAKVSTDGAGTIFGTTTNGYMLLATNNAERMRITSGGDVGINTATFENTNGTELNIKGGTNNTKPAVITLQGSSSNGAGYVQTEVFGISGVTSANEITRITGTGSNGFRMLIYITVTGHTGSVGNGHHIGKYYWDGATNNVTGISIDQSYDHYPQITFDTSTSNVCIVKLTSHNGSNTFNGVMEVKWYVPIDFASNTWQVS